MTNKLPKFIKVLLALFFLNMIFVLGYNSFFLQPAISSMAGGESLKGEKLFKANCAGCHLNGQNLIKPNKPIIGSQKLKSKETFKEFISSPPPPMPNFKNIVEKQAQLDSLYSYVVSLMGQ